MSKIQGLKNLTQPPYAEMIGSDLVACVQYAIDTLYLQDLVDAEQELSDAKQAIPGELSDPLANQIVETMQVMTTALLDIRSDIAKIERNTSKGQY